MPTVATAPPAARPITAAAIARAYDRYVAALWRGESEEVRRFGAWLKGHWGLGPSEPPTPPAAISALGGAGASIRWHEADGLLLGYIPGVPLRCYQIPTDADVPPIAAYADPARVPARNG